MAVKKYLPLGVVVKREASGMVLTDEDIRSNAKAEVGDTLRQNLETKEIEIVKAKPASAKDAKDIKALNARIIELESDLLEHKKEVDRLTLENEKLLALENKEVGDDSE